ncbi:hypothetical protein L3V82_07325 [Thiotrichales bacterium 19S3-7]|nr:hypothetical protein [Thiotrichales bacterium 19S3-7]MCF6801968.1 hypothetical protein [Thiotrichales bacterium 19S3-11]
MPHYPNISYAISTATLYTLLLIVPLIIGLFHQLILKPKNILTIYTNYYIGFNITLSSLFIACAYIFNSQSMAKIQNWPYSPMFIEYGILQAAICIISLISLWKNCQFKSAVVGFYSIYLLFFSTLQLIQVTHASSNYESSQLVELIYSLMLCVILIIFYRRLNKTNLNS